MKTIKEKINKQNNIKLKKLLHIKGSHRQNITQPTKWEAWSWRVEHNLATEQLNGKKYSQIIYPIKGLYPRYIKNSDNSTAKQSKKTGKRPE